MAIQPDVGTGEGALDQVDLLSKVEVVEPDAQALAYLPRGAARKHERAITALQDQGDWLIHVHL